MEPGSVPPRRWRGEDGATRGSGFRSRRRFWAGLAALVVVAGLLGVLSWMRPAPGAVLVPLWVGFYQSTRVPALPWTDADRRALRESSSFAEVIEPERGSSLRGRLSALAKLDATRTAVIYVSARSRVGEDGNGRSARILLLPEDAEPDRAGDWLPVDDVLEAVVSSPAAHKLLLLDILWPAPDADAAIPDGDVGQALADRLKNFHQDPRTQGTQVLTACGPGEVPWASEVLGQSAFGYYVDEALRGWADTDPRTGDQDGEVSVSELARYVQERVGFWAIANRGQAQTPGWWHAASAPDFPLARLSRGRPQPRALAFLDREPQRYPEWLYRTWKVRDLRAGDAAAAANPTALRDFQDRLLDVERDWRSGIGTVTLKRRIRAARDDFEKARESARDLRRPKPLSLARAGVQPEPGEGAFSRRLAQTLAAQGKTEAAPGTPPEPAEAELLATFERRSPEQQASLIVAAASLSCDDPRTILALDRFLGERQKEPRSFEALALRWLAERAGGPARDWSPEAARLLLEGTRLGEHALALAEGGAFTWVRPWLEPAAFSRHDGEALFLARGYAPTEQVVATLRSARAAYQDVLERAARIETARRTLNEALLRLPSMTPALPDQPERNADWILAADDTLQLAELLRRPPSNDRVEVARQATEVNRVADQLRRLLDGVLTPFDYAEFDRRLAPRVAQLDPSAVPQLETALATPLLSAEERRTIWARRLELARQLAERSMRSPAVASQPSGDRPAPGTGVGTEAGSTNIRSPIAARRPDLLRIDPTASTRAEARDAWAWMARHYRYEAADLLGSAYHAEAARSYRDWAKGPPAAEPQLALTPSALRLTGDRPAATATLRLVIVGPTDPSGIAPQGLSALVPDSRLSRVEIVPEARSPGVFSYLIQASFDPRYQPPGLALPEGFLVRIELEGRRFHRRVPLALVPDWQRIQVALGPGPEPPSRPTPSLRLRPLAARQPQFLFLTNPSDRDWKLNVELTQGGPPETLKSAVALPAGQTRKVVFGGPNAPPPAADAPAEELTGPLEVVLRDADAPAEVLAVVPIGIEVASPLEYVRIVEARYQPPSSTASARLMVRVRAVAPITGPPVPVELELPLDRIPGLLEVGSGTLRGELKAIGDELVLTAEDLRFDEASDERGPAFLRIDGVPRAQVLRVTWARQGEPTTPRLDSRPSVRLRSERVARSSSPLEVLAEVDNPPVQGRLTASLGRMVDGTFRPEVSLPSRPAQRQRVALLAPGPGGTLLFEASRSDWTLVFNARAILGRREVRVQLVDEQEEVRATESLVVGLDEGARGKVRFVDPPRYARRGASLVLRAGIRPSPSGADEVTFFLGRAAEDKPPPGAIPVPARPLDTGRSLWEAALPIPDERRGPVEISVRHVQTGGPPGFDTAVVEVVDTIPVVPGKIEGTVTEGPRPQSEIEVTLTDGQGGSLKTKTGRDGSFRFENVPPGTYTLLVVRATPPTRGTQTIEVKSGGTATVNVPLYRR